MDPLLIGLLLIAALAHASWNAMLKGKHRDPLTGSAGLSLVWALVGWPLTLVVDAPAPGSVPFLAVSVLVHLGYFTLLVAAYRRGDLSFVYPIARGLPPVSAAIISAAFLGETLGPLAAAGVFLIALGVLVIGWPTKDADAPRPLGLALATAGFITGYTLLDGWGVRAAGGAIPFLVWLTAVQGSLFFLGALALRRRALLTALWERPGPPLATGLLSAGGYGVALYAMAESPIALVSTPPRRRAAGWSSNTRAVAATGSATAPRRPSTSTCPSAAAEARAGQSVGQSHSLIAVAATRWPASFQWPAPISVFSKP